MRKMRLIAALIALMVFGLVAMPVGAGRQTITPQDVGSTSWISMTLTAENGDGYEFANNGKCYLVLSSPVSTTVSRTHYVTVTTNATFYGFAVADMTATIYGSSPKILGPFGPAAFNDTSGNVQVDMDPYGQAGDYRLAIVRVP